MSVDLPLRCRCGSLRGRLRGVGPSRGNRLVCHCDDCQAFAFFLERQDDVLDAHGGTDIFQTSPARIELDAGGEHLACVRLRPGGLLRWYAACCRTPIGNTMALPRVPFVGLIHSCVDHAGDGRTRDETLGPSRAGVFGRFARGDRQGLDAHDRAPVSLILRFGRILLPAWLRGDARRSPFRDPATLAPVVVPKVLTLDELRQVEAMRDAWQPPSGG